MPIALLGGAALVGAAVGAMESLLTRRGSTAADPPIEWNTVQPVPTSELAADDRAWEQRALGAAGDPGLEQRAVDEMGEPAWEQRAMDDAGGGALAARPASAIRASFGFCHAGGGVNCVVDGDTIWLGGQRIRVADIDAPETHPPNCAAEARLGAAATRRLAQLLNGGAVSLQAIDRDEDQYGRKLRVVLVDGRSVGDALVDEGLARSYGSGRRSWC